MHVFLHNICRINVSNHILLKGIPFMLSYSIQTWDAYVAGNLLKLKKRKNEACL